MKRFVISSIRFYQKYLSPRKSVPSCRFVPTCSEYAVLAVEKYGVVRGGLKAAWRLLRCNPLCRGGYDPLK